ncbi:MAG: amphi-Trp domain-containing protein [Gordonia sp. (in: high G+C Gram-positive bacteria)]|uniref:amphi-Trp domain-containing protein n=1 Tax=Gordonia sp. (in: high G+C Gram-positive bacteria) TaxID=84139 RepID=UPI003BB65AEE
MSDELFEYEAKEELTREEAAAKLRELADTIARHNEVSFTENNKVVRIDVPDRVRLKVEMERGQAGEKSELEVKLSWRE